MRAVAYFREDEGSSALPERSRLFLDFCRQNGFEAAATFLDIAKVDGEANGYHQLLDYLRQQQGFLFVAIASLQNLGRDLTQVARRYFQLSGLGVKVVSLEDGGDAGDSLLEVWSLSRGNGRQGERVREGMRQKAVKGEVLGRPPYGYKVGANRRLQITSEEGAVVRTIFRLYLKQGLGIRRIAKHLNENEYRTRKGGRFSMVTVRDILRNRAYIGTYHRFGVRVPASHPPLIALEDFQLVQDELDARRPTNQVRTTKPFLLSGLLYCSKCGDKMIGVTRKQSWQRKGDGSVQTAEYRYYQCESRTNRSVCGYQTHRAKDLEGEIIKRLADKNPATSTSNRELQALMVEAEAQTRRLMDKLKRLDRRLEQYLDAGVSGRLSNERVWSLGQAAAGEQLAIEASLTEASLRAQHQLSAEQHRQQQDIALKRLQKEWEKLSFSDQRETLRQLVERVVVASPDLEIVTKS